MTRKIWKLGETQKQMLIALEEHGSWKRGCGWLWDTPSGTERILNSLVARGLVYKDGDFYRNVPMPSAS